MQREILIGQVKAMSSLTEQHPDHATEFLTVLYAATDYSGPARVAWNTLMLQVMHDARKALEDAAQGMIVDPSVIFPTEQVSSKDGAPW